MYKYLLLFVMISASANAEVGASGSAAEQVGISVSYAQWENLPEDLQTAYISGALDSLLLYAADPRAQAISLHFHGCLKSREIAGSRLSDNVRSFTQGKPQSPTSVQSALLAYLVALCGKIPDPENK